MMEQVTIDSLANRYDVLAHLVSHMFGELGNGTLLRERIHDFFYVLSLTFLSEHK
jgi:hypothetical protein